MTSMIDTRFDQQKKQLINVYTGLVELTDKIGNAELSGTIKELAERLEEPFLFVIVGEVKVGKSSFVNALLESKSEICKVAPDPCTDVIQQIVHGENETRTEVNQYVHKIEVSADILKNISIVDTPGTNTIIDHHQHITETFIPHSDLIVFVFEAKNPYRQSSWELFNFIHSDWRKKIIFVLQQADLMEPDDLTVNLDGVQKMANEKGIENPQVFAVSAKQELKGLDELSGFKPLRSFISTHITGGNAIPLKLKSNVSNGLQIIEKIETALDPREKQLQADKAFRKEIDFAVNEQNESTRGKVDDLIHNLLLEYDKITSDVRSELVSGIGFFSLTKRSFRSVFGSEKPVKQWLKDLTGNLSDQLKIRFEERLKNGVDALATSVKQMVKIVELKIKSSATILEADNEIFGDIADKRFAALDAIRSNYTDFVNNTENFMDEELSIHTQSVLPDVATGGGLAIIGAVLATASSSMVFDVTGGIISALGLAFAGLTIFFKRRTALKAFDDEIKKGRTQLSDTLQIQLNAYIEGIKDKLNANFTPFDLHIKEEEQSIHHISQNCGELKQQLLQTDNELEIQPLETDK